ncbi:hypothetical protein C488_03130 [Natrinema pellirubrum DSM 15624]|uniref:AB hydrolase-1 domain-containing protein n=1 Tax=Natrinema pellirubrum (strain DSM 15624 / CIP 106293 / JCM 10476 / NCIMB 786 / 157) TaxID=797303 RepID=L9Z6B6_NATP1|nr:hypothetical protein C488_03130 [Natrinema pellirubrum DSM 15624]
MSSDVPAATESTTDRRTLLKATGTTLLGGAGLTAASGSASAQFLGPDTIEVDNGWFGWDADDDLPVTDELLVFIHGWFGDTTVSSQATDVRDSLVAGGYTPDETVAIEWPATTLNYFGAESDTEDVGEVVAGLIEDFSDAGGGNVRLVGHSLGGRCVYWTATKLSSATGSRPSPASALLPTAPRSVAIRGTPVSTTRVKSGTITPRTTRPSALPTAGSATPHSGPKEPAVIPARTTPMST